jgi:hypothetical protein
MSAIDNPSDPFDLLLKVLREQYTFLRKRNQEVIPG